MANRTYVGGPQHGKTEKGDIAAGYTPRTVIHSGIETGHGDILLYADVPEADVVAKMMDADKTIKPESPERRPGPASN